MAADGSCFILSGGDLFKSLLHKISCAAAVEEAAALAAALRVDASPGIGLKALADEWRR